MTANYKELESIALEKTPYLLDGLIPERGLGMFIGDWGIGKSPLALQLQLSLTANIPFLGKYASIPGDSGRVRRTLYVDLENGAHAVRNIVRTLSGYLELPAVPEGWNVYSPYYTPKPDAKKDWTEEQFVKSLLEAEHYDLCIIDPLRMFNPGAESKNDLAATMLRKMRRIINETGTTIMFIHHPRKPPADADVQRYHLDTNPSEWMANACGAASLIQNSDFRIGLEQNDDGLLMLRYFIRTEGWSSVQYIDRIYDADTDNPVGYVLKHGVEQFGHAEKQWYADLSFTFTTNEFKLVTKKNNRATNDILKRWISLMAIQKTGYGKWQKIILPAEAE